MVRLVLADDELHIRKRLSEKIDWDALGIHNVILCDDGDLALEEIEKQSIDILLTDIRMPRMDGLSLARKALKVNPKMQIIIMSAYDDKEYLKSAIDLRAVGYLDKPFDLDTVIASLKSAVLEVNVNQTALANIAVYNEMNSTLALSDAANQLCRYVSDSTKLRTCISEFNSSFLEASHYCTLLVKYIPKVSDSEVSDFTPSSKEMHRILINSEVDGIFTVSKNNMIVIHLALVKRENQLTLTQRLYDEFAQVFPDYRLSISVGNIITEHNLLYQSYQEAVIGMEKNFYYNLPIISPNHIKGSRYSFQEKDLDTFKIALASWNKSACYEYLDNLYITILKHNNTLVNEVKNHYFKLILIILSESPIFNTLADKNSEYYLYEVLFYIEALKELHNYIMELLTTYFTLKSDEQNIVADIDKLLKYINSRVNDPQLTLTEISAHHFMSVPYLCKYFKEQTGKTIKSYLIEYRMNYAKELLSQTNLKVSEIAEQVGFSDQNYFTKRFFKYFGITPSKFKETKNT